MTDTLPHPGRWGRSVANLECRGALRSWPRLAAVAVLTLLCGAAGPLHASAVSASAGGGAAADAAGPDDARLTALLDRMERVAALYHRMALRFECKETIEHRWHGEGLNGRHKFSYLYERDELGRFEDCRTSTTGVTGAKDVRCENPDEYKIPLYLSNAYLWIFAFRHDRQPLHEFRIVSDDIALGRPAVVVDYGPRDVIRHDVNDWYARVWIDRDTSQLLRVVGYQPGFWKVKQALEAAKQATRDDSPRTDYEIERVTTEFDEVKHGMRFASRVELRRSRYSWAMGFKEKKLLDVVQTYRNYRFYNVATEEAIQGMVDGVDDAAEETAGHR